MLLGERPTIFGPGDKTRDYTHVSDIVGADLLAMERGSNAIYNIGTGVETSDQEIFDAIAQALGYEDTPLYTSVRQGEIQRIYLNCDKAKKELGWSPKFSLGEGVQKTVPYYKSLGVSR
jgi:UDP-glucose 4-epimerase